jgi:AraC family transcriptional regulator of adaptative response/methylated-DNA-[protein]-cysteine methyltransferase
MNREAANYLRIEKAIEYLKSNFKSHPNLETIAKALDLSPYHFQRLFTEWAGVSPKKFIHYLSITYAKQQLKEREVTLFDLTDETGFSSTSRLHDLFVKIEGMTPGEYKNGGQQLVIKYHFENTIFGDLFIAATTKGICYMAFHQHEQEGLRILKSYFPNAGVIKELCNFHLSALGVFQKNWDNITEVKLHLKGTDFQLKVWEALLKIPVGSLTSYGNIAKNINHHNASRAVGTAVGDNLIAFLIPCHRVIQANGNYGQYRWGSNRKAAIIGWEAAYLENNSTIAKNT